MQMETLSKNSKYAMLIRKCCVHDERDSIYSQGKLNPIEVFFVHGCIPGILLRLFSIFSLTLTFRKLCIQLMSSRWRAHTCG